MISKAALMEALGKRFDYQSTRNVYRDALSRAGLADQDGFSAADIERFVTALKKTERRLEAVLGALGIGPAVAAAPAAAAAPAKPPAPAVEVAPEPAPEEAPVEAAAESDAPAATEAAPDGEGAAEAATTDEAAAEPEDDKRGKKHKKK